MRESIFSYTSVIHVYCEIDLRENRRSNQQCSIRNVQSAMFNPVIEKVEDTKGAVRRKSTKDRQYKWLESTKVYKLNIEA